MSRTPCLKVHQLCHYPLEKFMSDSTTATVETLTAEVRTLVVGSRQVTMSVFNQLDKVDPDQIEPMGRVAPREREFGYVHVVGRHVTTGALVSSRRPGAASVIKDLAERHYGIWNLSYALTMAERKESATDSPLTAAEADLVAAKRDAAEGKSWRTPSSVEYAERMHAEAAARHAEAKERVAQLTHAVQEANSNAAALSRTMTELAEQWSALPLVVLAGLR